MHEHNHLGNQMFKLNGQLHNPDAPAWVGGNGDLAWWQNGERHRTDGPAVVGADGRLLQWWVNGKRHRSDGPAIISKHQGEQWWLNGVRHRTDGPALTDPNGRQSWWIQGKDMTNQVNLWMHNKEVTWPWDADTQAEFVLTWC